MGDQPQKSGKFGGVPLMGCGCATAILGLGIGIVAFGIPMISGGAVTDAEVFQPWTGYCSACCCCIGTMTLPIAGVIIFFEPRDDVKT